jgi:2-deoxy-D-gluconate 3-dehydrogenase
MKAFDLSGKRAAVTGASRGLGQAMAISLADAGADVVLIQRNEFDTKTRDKIRKLGRTSEILTCDLAKPDQVRDLVERVEERVGSIDIWVNNAGIQRRAPAAQFSETDWYEVLQVHLQTVFLLCREAGSRMLKRGSGKIINVASLLSFQGGIYVPAYAAAKGGVVQLTKALSNEWASQGVNVNAVAPGYFETEMNDALMKDPVRSRQILERIPAGRWGKPEDISGAVVYLASGASNYVNGHVLVVDGGWLGR